MIATVHYFNRAYWALHNAHQDALPLNVRGHLTAVAVHACQSLKESLDQLAQDNPTDADLAGAIKGLPHTKLIENIRNMDLHGCPLPICDPKVQMSTMVSKPSHPIELSSSHNVAVALRMDGLKPRVHRTPKDLKHGTATIGGATVSFGCFEGKLVVHDSTTGKDYVLLGVLRAFLEGCHPIIKSRMPEPTGNGDPTQGDAS